MKRIILMLLGIMTLTACSQSSVKGEVVDKYEYDGKCYVDLQIEVAPEEYIGLDQGDEYGR